MKFRISFSEAFHLAIGTGLAGAGCAYFLIPGELASGGVNGIGTIAFHLFGWDPGLVMMAINVPIILLGMKIFGWLYGVKTVLGSVALSLWISLFGLLSEYKGVLPYVDRMDTLLSAIFGGVLLGVGIGIAMRGGANTGGTDVLAQIMHKYTPLPMGVCTFIPNAVVLLLGFWVFGLQKGLFAMIQQYASSMVVGYVVMGIGTHYAKAIYIFSKRYTQIGQRIIHDLHHGGTLFHGTGIFTGARRTMLLAIIPNQQIYQLVRMVHEIDPEAFMLVSEAYQVIGTGFVPLEKIMNAHPLEGTPAKQIARKHHPIHHAHRKIR